MISEEFDFDVETDGLSDQERIDALAAHYREILRLVGEDPDREGLLKTPMRAAKAMWFATQGYRTRPSDILRQAIFEYAGSRMVVVRDIEFYSMCEHHILPFFGTVSVAYVPDGSMIGLSKLPRLVNAVARKLQVQERLTAEICREVKDTLSAKGVMCECRAQHLCMQMRGVEKQLSSTVTVDYNGVFETDASLRQEFFNMIK
mgnify:CR=1 FL=1